MDFCESYGETITGKSWLMRDLWQTTNMNYGDRWGLATNPKRLKSSGLKRLLDGYGLYIGSFRLVWDKKFVIPSRCPPCLISPESSQTPANLIFESRSRISMHRLP
jgi:hypothetical protein